MISKDEALAKFSDDRYCMMFPFGYNMLYNSMDLFAEQIAIGFADFTEKYFSYSYGSYDTVDVNYYPYTDLSTKQVYQLYLEYLKTL